MTYLKMKIIQMNDGRFFVRYWWGWFGYYHKQYFDNMADLQKFLSKIVEKTEWN